MRQALRPNWSPVAGVLLGACAACSTPTPPADADAQASDATDAAADVAADVPENPPNPSEPLLAEQCGSGPRTGAPTAFVHFMGASVGALRDMLPGDWEAVHIVPEHPTRVERLKLWFRGAAGGRVRVKIQRDYGRSQPDVEQDLIAPIDLDFVSTEPVELALPRPLEVHPANHVWIVIEHLVEPMGLALAPTAGGDFRSFFHSVNAIDQNRAGGGDPTFEWFPITGQNDARYEFMVEARGQIICARPATTWFTDVTMAAGLRGTSVQTNWVDVDHDGADDIVGAVQLMDRDVPVVYRNRRDGTFEDTTAALGLDAARGRLVLWGDYDGDRDQDVYVGVYRDGVGPFDPASPSRVWTQGADRRFTVTANTMEPAGPTAAGSVGDCDRDGVLDLAVGQWLRQYPRNPAPDYFFRGSAMAGFTLANAAAMLPATSEGRPTYGMSWVDFDDDGDLDLMVANYGGANNDAWRNDGACRFANVARDLGFDSDRRFQAGTSFGHAWADYDNDGDLDAFESNIGHPRYDAQGTDHSRLLRNTGAPNYRFENAVDASGIAFVEGDISSAWGDYDNDGDLDLYVASTYPFQYSRLYRQESDHRFTDVTYAAGVAAEFNGRASWHDYDRDGDLDLLVGPRGNWQLFRNNTRNDNHWIELRLEEPTGNTDALGARVTIAQRDGMGPERTQLREVSGGEAVWATQPSRVQHFGLGASAASVTVRVRWPDGTRAEYTGLAVDKRYRIERGSMPVEVPPR
ncbi:MAG: CRTAC1 family protein [Myxococcales bacterium]|nr:CRTAC1 family protein [Myxococcales bacterium]